MCRCSCALALAAFTLACKDGGDASDVVFDPGLPLLGGNTHSADAVDIAEVANADDQVNTPRDVAFHPEDPQQLWVLNRGGPSVTLVNAVGTEERSTQLAMGGRQDCGEHFMAEPSALAFGENGFLATSHEEEETTPCTGGANGIFMGPTLWIQDPTVFNADWLSHYDMLHNSPNGVGIAWEQHNTYWVYDGYHLSLTRYDFANDHGPGGEDHSDGIVRRYVEGEVGYLPDVVSHLAYDPFTDYLYAADAANGRVVVLDTRTGEEGGRITPNFDGGEQTRIEGADLWTLVEGAEHGLTHPAGLKLHQNMVWVTDNATGRIAAFTMDGELVDWLDTGVGAGALMGLTFDSEGRLYVADAVNHRVLRISAR